MHTLQGLDRGQVVHLGNPLEKDFRVILVRQLATRASHRNGAMYQA